jgi:Domain of unknown function (DUF4943)
MKTNIYEFIILLTVIFFSESCTKDFDFEKPDVDEFVSLVRDGKYTSEKMPNFSPSDIPGLLKYANDTSEIKTFPKCPISSYTLISQKFILGECVLWTIESIRVTYYQSDWHQRFPSYVPKVYKEMKYDSAFMKHLSDIYTIPPPDWADYFINKDELQVVYNKYKNWWVDNSNKNFDDYQNINPLEDSGLAWLGKCK